MPLPKSVTEADLARWNETFEHYEGSELTRRIMRLPGVKERVWFPLEWLDEQLTGQGCPRELRSRINFAAGQRLFFADDGWDTVELVLANYREGDWDTPGMELMDELFREHEWP